MIKGTYKESDNESTTSLTASGGTYPDSDRIVGH